jgi:hypothetical protein
MTAVRTVIGPLTTTWTPPGYCGNVVVACPYSCDSGWQVGSQTLFPNWRDAINMFHQIERRYRHNNV